MMVVLAMAACVWPSVSIEVEDVRKFSYERDDHRIPLRRLQGKSPLFFQSKMSCDVDGAPNAYHSIDDNLSLDVIGSAEGRRFGDSVSGPLEVEPSPDIIVYADGKPYIQTSGEYAGFFVSGTSLYDPVKRANDPTKYLDSRVIQYIVLPAGLCPEAKVGDLAAVYDPASKKVVYAVFGDVGPSSECGEASIATLRRLGLNTPDGKSSPGEYRDDLFYVVFPGTASQLAASEPWPHKQSTIDSLAATEFASWGGVDQVEQILTEKSGAGSIPDSPENRWIYNELALGKQRGWIHTTSIGLPDRLSSRSSRLPCAPEVVVACRDAIDAIQSLIEGDEKGVRGLSNENFEFHLRQFSAIIGKFPEAADDEGVSPDRQSARVAELVSRLQTIAIGVSQGRN